MSTPVKKRRPYDATGRRDKAREARTVVLAAARRLFLEGGYGPTTVAAIAAEGGVSTETIYKTFGGKAGLVRALADQALAGAGPEHAEVRSDRLSATEGDARAILRGWGKLMTEVSPRIAPILLLIDAAASTDVEMAALAKAIAAQRLERMTHNARRLVDAGHVREGIDVAHAADVMWTYTSADLYALLVLERRWSVERYATFASEALIAALLPVERLPPSARPRTARRKAAR